MKRIGDRTKDSWFTVKLRDVRGSAVVGKPEKDLQSGRVSVKISSLDGFITLQKDCDGEATPGGYEILSIVKRYLHDDATYFTEQEKLSATGFALIVYKSDLLVTFYVDVGATEFN